MKRTISLFVLLMAIAVAPGAAYGQWSVFDPIERPTPPQVDNQQWSAPIDAFIYARLKESGLTPAPAVDRRVWLRRVTYDLLGLPPTPGEVRRLLDDPRPDEVAMSETADRLLASGRYGERWGRHWLDVVRYADSDGFAIDKERLWLWRFRDYAIRVLNEDRAFDQFIREQIAGDEIEAGEGGKLAVSYYRLGPWEADNMTAENRRQDYLNDITSNVGSAFLGLTIGCARCHDHKFDPILQADFYQLQAFFTPLKHKPLAIKFLPGEMTPAIKRRHEQTVGRRLAKINQLRAAIRKKIADAKKVAPAKITDAELDEFTKEKKAPVTAKEADELKALMKDEEHLRPEQRFEPRAVAVQNPAPKDKIPQTFVLENGDVFAPAVKVVPGFLSEGEPWSKVLSRRAAKTSQTGGGRRSILADWLTRSNNPITPRVLVNRLWNYHFGVGIVATPNDFGENGSGASHPRLLDYLARRLMDHRWRLKPLHREIVLSRAYRSSSRHPQFQQCAKKDPQNRHLWRSHYRRLEAETLRDAVLAVSGRLNLETGGPGFFQDLPEGMETSYSFFKWKPSTDEQQRRRSIYMFQRRNLVHPMMETFDGADLNQSCERRLESVTAPQALSMMNGAFVHQNCLHLAQRLHRDCPDDSQRVEQIFWLALSRAPTNSERDACITFLNHHLAASAPVADSVDTKSLSAVELKSPSNTNLLALRNLCLAILNTNEFMYLD